MHAKAVRNVLVVVIALIFLGSMFACAGREFAPKDPYPYWYYPKELTNADREVEKLREACPKHYAKEKARLDKAYEEYVACKTPDIKIEPCPTPPPPTCKLETDKTTIKLGESVNLTLKRTSGEVTSAMIDKESVATTGGTITRKPEKATKFIATVDGPGGSGTCTAPVSVSLALGVHFPFDRPKGPDNKKFPHDEPETWFDKPDAINPKDSIDPCKDSLNQPLEDNLTLLKRAVDFVKNNPGTDIKVTGHTDCLGPREYPDKYNDELSKRRAHAVAAYLKKKLGLGNISWEGLGSRQPYPDCEQFKQGKCDRDACDCRAKNRRVVITVSPR